MTHDCADVCEIFHVPLIPEIFQFIVATTLQKSKIFVKKMSKYNEQTWPSDSSDEEASVGA